MQKSVILLYMYNGFLLSWDRGLWDRGLTPVPESPVPESPVPESPVPTIFNIMEKDNE